MVKKLEEPLSQVRGWVNGRIAIAIARSYSRMIAELVSPVPCGTGNWIGTRDRASSRRNKSRARIILRAHLRNCFLRLHDPVLPPLVCSSCTRYPWLQTRENIRGPDHVCFRHSGRRKKYIDAKNREFCL